MPFFDEAAGVLSKHYYFKYVYIGLELAITKFKQIFDMLCRLKNQFKLFEITTLCIE